MEVNVVLAGGFLHGMGALVVVDVEIGVYTVLLEVLVACCPGCSDLQGLPGLEKLVVDGVGIVVVEDEDKLVSALIEYR